MALCLRARLAHSDMSKSGRRAKPLPSNPLTRFIGRDDRRARLYPAVSIMCQEQSMPTGARYRVNMNEGQL